MLALRNLKKKIDYDQIAQSRWQVDITSSNWTCKICSLIKAMPHIKTWYFRSLNHGRLKEIIYHRPVVLVVDNDDLDNVVLKESRIHTKQWFFCHTLDDLQSDDTVPNLTGLFVCIPIHPEMVLTAVDDFFQWQLGSAANCFITHSKNIRRCLRSFTFSSCVGLHSGAGSLHYVNCS